MPVWPGGTAAFLGENEKRKTSRGFVAAGRLLLCYFRIDSMRRRKSFRAQTVGTG